MPFNWIQQNPNGAVQTQSTHTRIKNGIYYVYTVDMWFLGWWVNMCVCTVPRYWFANMVISSYIWLSPIVQPLQLAWSGLTLYTRTHLVAHAHCAHIAFTDCRFVKFHIWCLLQTSFFPSHRFSFHLSSTIESKHCNSQLSLETIRFSFFFVVIINR